MPYVFITKSVYRRWAGLQTFKGQLVWTQEFISEHFRKDELFTYPRLKQDIDNIGCMATITKITNTKLKGIQLNCQTLTLMNSSKNNHLLFLFSFTFFINSMHYTHNQAQEKQKEQ